jgi:glycosyltransferase involved in cell wall biosynthesis
MINLIFFLPTFDYGGAGNSVVRLCKKLSKKKYSISIISIGKCAYKKELKSNHINVFELNTKKTVFSFFKIREITKKIYTKNKTKTIFISGHHYANVISIIALGNLKFVKIVVVERTDLEELKIYYTFINFIKNLFIYLLVLIFYKKANAIITNSRSAKLDLKKKCNLEAINIKPPSVVKILPKTNKKNKKQNYVVITVGRLSKEKGIDTMIKAFNEINSKNIILKILGDGKEKNNLQRMIYNYKLERRVFLLGLIKNPEKNYLNSDLFIHASHFEGFPNSIAEAINHNLPVICSDCKGGTREILLNGKGGDLFPVNNHRILASKINSFFKNPKPLKKKLALARKKINQYTLEKNISRYDKLFTKI